jgi:hypothetical protein
MNEDARNNEQLRVNHDSPASLLLITFYTKNGSIARKMTIYVYVVDIRVEFD